MLPGGSAESPQAGPWDSPGRGNWTGPAARQPPDLRLAAGFSSPLLSKDFQAFQPFSSGFSGS